MTIAALITGGLGVSSRPATLIKGGLSSRRQLPEPPPSGYTQITLGALIDECPFEGIATADVLQYKPTTLEGYGLLVGFDGEVTISAGGDNSRQRILWNFWDASADEMRFTGDSTVAANDQAPTVTQPTLSTIYAQPNVAFQFNLLLASDAADFEGDALRISAVAGATPQTSLPPGGVIDENGVLIGPFTLAGVYTYIVRVEDEYGAYVDTSQTAVIGNLALPDVRAKSTVEALTILQGALFTNITVPGVGTVEDQTPPAGTVMDPTAVVVLTLVDEEGEEEPPPPPLSPPAALHRRRTTNLRNFLLG